MHRDYRAGAGGFRQSDLNSYFDTAGPKVTAISVDRGRNAPTSDPNGPDGEVMLDIEVAGAVAPRGAIAVYFAPNTNKGLIDAISAALHDKLRNPSVISISWGLTIAAFRTRSLVRVLVYSS